MKTLVFRDSAGLQIEYLTDLIGDNKQFTIYQIQHRNSAGKMVIGLSDAEIAAGWDHKVAEYDLGTMIAWAKTTNCTLTAVDTGNAYVTVNQGGYYGGAIGIDLLD
jgi:hypothetical protein